MEFDGVNNLKSELLVFKEGILL